MRSPCNPRNAPTATTVLVSLDDIRILMPHGAPPDQPPVLGADISLIRIFSGLLSTVRPLAEQRNVPMDQLGDFGALPERIQAEIVSANTVAGFLPIVSAWSRKPVRGQQDSVEQK